MCQFHMQNYDANKASIPRGLNSFFMSVSFCIFLCLKIKNAFFIASLISFFNLTQKALFQNLNHHHFGISKDRVRRHSLN